MEIERTATKTAVQQKDQVKIYLDRINSLLKNSKVLRTVEDIEGRRNKLGFFKDEVTGNELDDNETYLIGDRFFTNPKFADAIQQDSANILVETIQQAKNRFLEKNEKNNEEIKTFEKPYFSTIYCNELLEQYGWKIEVVYKKKQGCGEVYTELEKIEEELKIIFAIYVEQIRDSCMVPGTRPKDRESEGIITNSYTRHRFQKTKKALWALYKIFPVE